MSSPNSIYQTLFDRLPIGMFRIDPSGSMLKVNKALVDMLDYPDTNSLTDRTLSDLIASDEEYRIVFNHLEKLGALNDYELQLRCFDEKLLWARLNARLVRDKDGATVYYEGAFEDISREVEASEALQESDQLTRTIIDSVSEGVIVFDRKLRYVVWNDFMQRLTGMSDKEVIGKYLADHANLIPDPTLESSVQRAMAGETVVQRDIQLADPKGHNQRWFSTVYSPHRNSNGDIIGIVVTVHDTTERKLADEDRENRLTLEREQRLQTEAVSRVSKALNAVLDLPSLLELICRETSELFGVDATLVWLVDRESGTGDVIENIAGYGWEHERFAGMQINLDDMNNLATRVIHQREPIIVNEATDSVHTGLSGVFRVQSILCVPLFQGEDVIGVLQIIDNHRMNRFAEKDIAVAMQLGSHAAIAVKNAQLYDQLQDTHRELEKAYGRTLEGWAKALELRDANTEGHSNRVTEMALRLAKALGVPEDDLEQIRRGALLHDIGKMGIPDRILEKPGPLTDEEWEVMREHPGYAHSMLAPIEYLRPALDIPFSHHERWDGSGYPQGLAGKEIPLPARIFAVVDVYDALTSDRPYRSAWTHEEAIEYIKKEAGKHFDPEIVAAFLKII